MFLLLQPAPEQVVGKEKKRKKLDEIVLGLSAAKGKPLSATLTPEPSRSRNSTILPDVTVTPAVPSTSSSGLPPQKPFSVTVTNVPSPQASTKELSSFLQQSLEQSKGQKSSTMTPSKAYSHEAKVNKWLAEQANVESRRRNVTPRLSPDEHVPVVHRVTGKRLLGHKAPQLKHLAQWIAENPMYDIDSKWTEGIKEHVKLPQDVRSQRHSPMQPSGQPSERKKGRPPTLDSSSSNILSSSSHLNQSLSGLNPALLASLSSLSAFDPKTLAATLSNLTGFDPKLNTFDPKLLSSLSSFDPKNNPLLNTFSSMPNLLGNIAGGNIFANLAGLGLPGFSSLDMSSLSGGNLGADKSKSRKPTDLGNPSTSKSTSSQFPFAFPNPNMLYPQLGLGGLSPFGMHSGVSSYDALGLLSGNITASSGSSVQSSSHSSARTSTKTSTPRSATVVSSSSASRHQKVSERQHSTQMPQIHLPPDPYLIESLSKQALSYEAMLRSDKRSRETESHESTATDLSKTDKKKMPYDALRTQVPPEFAAVQEKLLKGDKKDIDISKMLLEQMASGALSASLVSSNEIKKVKDNDKESYEKLNRSSSEYISRTLASDDGPSAISLTHKRTHEEICEPENLALHSMEMNPAKKIKETSEIIPTIEKNPDHSSNTGEMDLEDLIAPSTVIKTGMKASDFDNNVSKLMPTDLAASSSTTPSNLSVDRNDKLQIMSTAHEDQGATHPQICDDHMQTVDLTSKGDSENKDNFSNNDETNTSDVPGDGARKGNRKKSRKSSEEMLAACPRRELRSSAGRQSTDTAN